MATLIMKMSFVMSIGIEPCRGKCSLLRKSSEKLEYFPRLHSHELALCVCAAKDVKYTKRLEILK